MVRRTAADRLQAGFERIPLTNEESEARRAAIEAKPWVRRTRKWTAIGSFTFFGLMAVFLVATSIVWANWWNVKTSMVCTISDMDHYAVDGKGGYDHTVYDVYTTTCGDLQIMPGAGRNDRQAIAFAKSLRIGDAYELDVRGWDGWMGNSRAIAAARKIGETP